MTRQEALTVLRNTAWLGTDEHREAVEVAIEVLEETSQNLAKPFNADQHVQRVGSVGEWIPCSERLPSEHREYLVTYDGDLTGKTIAVMWYGNPLTLNDDVDENRKYFYLSDPEWGDVVHEEVTAWMPLPEPYGGESE